MDIVNFLESHRIWTAIFFGAAGACVASYIGLLADRLPYILGWRTMGRDTKASNIWQNTTTQRSLCGACHHPLDALSLVPILGWLIRGGKCHFCEEKISPIYPIFESVLFFLSFLLSLELGFGLNLCLFILALWAVASLAFIDFAEAWLPLRITIPLLSLGFILSPYGDQREKLTAMAIAVACMVLSFALTTIRHRINVFNGGDLVFLAAAGAWFGFPKIVLLLIGVFLSHLIFYVVAIMVDFKWRPKDLEMSEYLSDKFFMPMGPFIAISFIMMLFVAPYLH